MVIVDWTDMVIVDAGKRQHENATYWRHRDGITCKLAENVIIKLVHSRLQAEAVHLKEFAACEWPTHLGVPQDMPTKDTWNKTSKTRIFHATKAGRICQIPNEVMSTGVYAPSHRNEPMKTKKFDAASGQ